MRRRVLLLVLFVVLTMTLAVLLREFARDLIFPALWRLFWEARLWFESLPQLPIWDLLLVALLILAVASLLRRRRSRQEEAAKEVESPGRVQVVTQWIQLAPLGEYFEWTLTRSLGELTLEVIAYREHTTTEQLRQRLREGRLDLPPAIQAHLHAAEAVRFTTSRGVLLKVRNLLARTAPPPPPDPVLDTLVGFLEDQLDIRPQLLEGPRPEPGPPTRTKP